MTKQDAIETARAARDGVPLTLAEMVEAWNALGYIARVYHRAARVSINGGLAVSFDEAARRIRAGLVREAEEAAQ